MKEILITNDDGCCGHGLFPLIEALLPLGRITVVVPRKNRSASSHSITLDKPVSVARTRPALSPRQNGLLARINRRFFVCSGTPVDCVRLGYLALVRRKIDLLVSGINIGANLGMDVTYSSTVACAREGAIEGIPSVAVSYIPGNGKPDLSAAQAVSYHVCKNLLAARALRGVYFNVNIPSSFAGGRIVLAELGERRYGRNFVRKRISKAVSSFTLVGRVHETKNNHASDVAAIGKKCAAMTPIPLFGSVRSLIKRKKACFKKILSGLPF